MKYLAAVIKNSMVLLAVVLLNFISFAGHTYAMPSMSHETGSMDHGSSDTALCATFCRTAVVNKEENITRNNEDEDDDKTATLSYAQNPQIQSDNKSITQHLYAADVKPPPKIPIYILYGVFRA